MSEHAKGLIRVGRAGAIVSDDPGAHLPGGDHVEYYGGYLVGESITPSNASRLVACWNKFEGMTTEQIERMPGTVQLLGETFMAADAEQQELIRLIDLATTYLEDGAPASALAVLKRAPTGSAKP